MAFRATEMSPFVNEWDTWLKLTEIERNIDAFIDLSGQYEVDE